jgi:AIR synthase-related protein
MDIQQIASALRSHPSITSKLAIGDAVYELNLGQDHLGHPGDDAAFLARKDGGYDLLAGEGFIPEFVNDDPWFAGWCGVMVNISDIAAMGGRAIGVIDQIWSPNVDVAKPVLKGMRDAARAYGISILGGHTNFNARELNMAVTIFGRANALITSFDAQPGDILIAAIDHGGTYRNFDNFFAADQKNHTDLRAELELLPQLAEEGLVRAGKDVSQGGIIGTALMLAECSGVGIDIDLGNVLPPCNIDIERWMRSFPSFGFLLAVSPVHVPTVQKTFADRAITAQSIGTINDGKSIDLSFENQSVPFWNYQTAPYLALGKMEVCYA